MSSWFRTYGFTEIDDHLVIGAYPLDHDDVGMLEWAGIERVLNLVQDEEYRPGERDAIEQALSAKALEEHRFDFTDFGGLPPDELEAAVQEVCTWLDEGRTTYVHCRAGWQRSAAVAAGVVALRQGIDIDEALDYVRRRKPTADPLPHQREDLRRWWAARAQPARPD